MSLYMTPNPMNLFFSSVSFVTDKAMFTTFPSFFTRVVSKFFKKPFSRVLFTNCSSSPC